MTFDFLRKLRGLAKRKVELFSDEISNRFVLPLARLHELACISENSWVQLHGSQIFRPRDMVLPLEDLLCLSVVCRSRNPRAIFEVGTYTGETTLLMAANTESDCKIFTLDLPLADITPVDKGGYLPGSFFHGNSLEKKILQLHGRSESFDFSVYAKSMDLIFIDGDHRYEFVKKDTENALKMIKPGGLIVWDDYRYLPCHEGCRGVSDYLHSIRNLHPVRQLEGTRLAVLER
jgi:predicted O-methyltransferase YrrM